MGGSFRRGSFEATDWASEMRKIQEDAEDYYGYQDGYSGAENSCQYSYRCDLTRLTEKEIEKYINSRMNYLGNGEGEVVKSKQKGFNLITTTIEETNRIPYNLANIKVKQGKNKLILYHEDSSKEVAEGSLIDMKNKVHCLLRGCNYTDIYFIISHNKVYRCEGKTKFVNKTERKSTDRLLIIPKYEFLYYGWCRE